MIYNSPYKSASFTIAANQGAFYQAYETAQVPVYANEVIEGCFSSMSLHFNLRANYRSVILFTYTDLCEADFNGNGYAGLSDLVESIFSFGSFCP